MTTDQLQTYLSITMASITFLWYLAKTIYSYFSPKYQSDHVIDNFCAMVLIPFSVFLLGWFIALITVIVSPIIVAVNAYQLILKYKRYEQINR